MTEVSEKPCADCSRGIDISTEQLKTITDRLDSHETTLNHIHNCVHWLCLTVSEILTNIPSNSMVGLMLRKALKKMEGRYDGD